MKLCISKKLTRLRIFMQISILTNRTKRIEFKWRFLSFIKRYKEYSTFIYFGYFIYLYFIYFIYFLNYLVAQPIYTICHVAMNKLMEESHLFHGNWTLIVCLCNEIKKLIKSEAARLERGSYYNRVLHIRSLWLIIQLFID